MNSIAIILALIIGVLSKGKISNLCNIQLKKIHLIFIAISLEIVIKILLRNEIIYINNFTFAIDIIMYFIIFLFIFINRENKFILLMGLGFLLNAIVIFSNGGVMPVSKVAMESLGANYDVTKTGLYVIASRTTKFYYLSDIIPGGVMIMSIGDIISALAMMGFIIKTMKNESLIGIPL
ncbi:DUF5317 family protein [Clostridium grantii]|uniref:DUF5317 domain-containing protein n=1 Tax=Clostridium grantii DSM 8605 TaxID=1121316 RepID=A0A1M5RN74_9CLOT|nr:DUF5317 family protein [Clostridium grantii]SHH27787.1 hypothetical protein SAMN02745207_00629 [Clostridium grantii DSM 8605]